MSEVKAGQARIALRDNNTVVVIAENASTHTKDDAVAVMAAVEKLLSGRRLPMLLNMAGSAGLENAARDYYNGRAPALVTAIAIVTQSIVGRVIANFLIALNAGVLPIRLFTEESVACDWLATHRRV